MDKVVDVASAVALIFLCALSVVAVLFFAAALTP